MLPAAQLARDWRMWVCEAFRNRTDDVAVAVVIRFASVSHLDELRRLQHKMENVRSADRRSATCTNGVPAGVAWRGRTSSDWRMGTVRMKPSYILLFRYMLFMTIRRNVTRSTAHSTESTRAVTVAALARTHQRTDKDRQQNCQRGARTTGQGCTRQYAPWGVVHECQLTKAATRADLDDLQKIRSSQQGSRRPTLAAPSWQY